MSHRFAPNKSMLKVLDNVSVLRTIRPTSRTEDTMTLQKSSTEQCDFRRTTGSPKSGCTPRGLVYTLAKSKYSHIFSSNSSKFQPWLAEMGTGHQRDGERRDTGVRDFVDEIEFLDGDLIDFVHDIDAADVDTVS